MKIIGISGVLDLNRTADRLWRYLGEEFHVAFPDCSIAIERTFYLPWQRTRIRAFSERIVAKHDDGEPIILLGYSMGGVIACDIANKFRQSSVRAIVTIVSPLALHRRSVAAPLISFVALFDLVVPYPMAWHRDARRILLWSDHLLCFLVSRKPARAIASQLSPLLSQLSSSGISQSRSDSHRDG